MTALCALTAVIVTAGIAVCLTWAPPTQQEAKQVRPAGTESEPPSLFFPLASSVYYEATFDTDPRLSTGARGYSWNSHDLSDSSPDQLRHRGLLSLHGGQFVNLTASAGDHSLGSALRGPIGGPGTGASVDGSGGWSFEFALKLSDAVAGFPHLFNAGPAQQVNSCYDTVFMSQLSNGLGLELSVCDPYSNNANDPSSSLKLQSEWDVGRWYHVVAVIQRHAADGNATIKLYQNGVTVGVKLNAYYPLATARPNTLLGRSNYASDGEWSGLIDFVRIYSVALTTEQIRSLYSASMVPASDDWGAEQWRPRLHYSVAQDWTNDPNGLIYDSTTGQWHMYYQYSPNNGEVDDANDITWGHAESRDLIQWRETGVAVTSYAPIGIFSGTAAFDPANTSGLCASSSCMVAVYAGQDFDRWVEDVRLAVSSSPYEAFTHYTGNPVLTLNVSNFRDPFVFWYNPSDPSVTHYQAGGDGYWVCVVTSPMGPSVLLIYRSADLIQWSHMSTFTDAPLNAIPWECPGLAPLTVAEGGGLMWVMMASVAESAGYYWVGTFDGRSFTAVQAAQQSEYGADNYAGLTFANTLGGRLVQVWWFSRGPYDPTLPTYPWRGQMTLPKELTLHRYHDVTGRLLYLVEKRAIVEADEYLTPKPRFSLAQPVLVTAENAASVLCEAFRTVYRLTVNVSVDLRQPVGFTLSFGIRQSSDAAEQSVVSVIVDPSLLAPGVIPMQVVFNRSRTGESRFSDAFPLSYATGLVYTEEFAVNGSSLDVEVYVDESTVEILANHGQLVASYLHYPSLTRSNRRLCMSITSDQPVLVNALEVHEFDVSSLVHHVSVNDSVNEALTSHYFVSDGSDRYRDSFGHLWLPDQPQLRSGAVRAAAQQAYMFHTADPVLWGQGRVTNSTISWAVPVTPGWYYAVTVYGTEDTFASVGQRSFNVSVDGALALTEVDWIRVSGQQLAPGKITSQPLLLVSSTAVVSMAPVMDKVYLTAFSVLPVAPAPYATRSAVHRASFQ